jgi:glyoxylase-like metal-dependent hydrolase (beta-lactamase superfamily II)
VLNAAVTSHPVKALANLMRHVVTTVVVLVEKVAVTMAVALTLADAMKATSAVVAKVTLVEIQLAKAAVVLAAITALLLRPRVVLMTVLHADHVLCLKVNVHRLTKKLRALNQAAASHLVV